MVLTCDHKFKIDLTEPKSLFQQHVFASQNTQQLTTKLAFYMKLRLTVKGLNKQAKFKKVTWNGIILFKITLQLMIIVHAATIGL